MVNWGIIIRDSEGQVLAAVSSAGPEGGDLFARRLLCLTRALMFAGEIGFFDVEIDIADARLFHALSSKSLDNSRWGHLIEGVRLCLQACASLQSKVMAVAVFVGGAVLGAAFGEVFAVLHDTVKNVGSKVLMFKSVLKSLESNLDLLAPVVEEISGLNRELGRPEEETKSLIEDMKKAEELIRTCSAISGWSVKFQAHHSKQLTELDKAIVKFCRVHMPAQIKRDTLQILKDTSQISQILEDKSSQILGNTSQISQILEDKSSQILGNTSQISQILEDTSQISQMIWEEFKAFREENKLKKEKVQIPITPCRQCGNTTPLEIQGHDVPIKVKQLSSKSKQGSREFVNEIGMISGLQHPNLVRLYGCCIEAKQLLLVYEYMENNSLANALFGPVDGQLDGQLKLDWPARQKICLGIARGTLTLRSLTLVLAKLDEEENTHISTRIAGTIGYIAPEYVLSGHLTYKADVYSFGVGALEIVAGRMNIIYRPDEYYVSLLDWAKDLQQKGDLMKLVDPELEPGFHKEEALRMIKLALLCTNPSPALRPPMNVIVGLLEGWTVVDELARDPSVYGNEWNFEALRDQFDPTIRPSSVESQSLSQTSNATWIGSTSTSAHYLYSTN
uniref:Protein kinase domain-containing protein n=1 Tax=Fagus sylvatica TaxID=28930 RepID=A0A2N9F7D7_FAGSY